MIRVECSTIIPDKDTKITDKDGRELNYTSKMELVLEAQEPNKAILYIDQVEFIDIKAEPILSKESIEKMAEYWGLEVAEKHK